MSEEQALMTEDEIRESAFARSETHEGVHLRAALRDLLYLYDNLRQVHGSPWTPSALDGKGSKEPA